MFLGEEWSGSLSVPKGRVLHAVHEMLSERAGRVQSLANCLNSSDFALSGEAEGGSLCHLDLTKTPIC